MVVECRRPCAAGDGARAAAARAAVQRRTDGAARPRAGADAPHPRKVRARPAARAAGRQPEGARRRPAPCSTEAVQARPPPDAGRRMAARQLLPDRGADRASRAGTCRAATAASCRGSTSGPSAGLPRVYDIALNAISHGDGRVDAESLSRFVAAYQTVTPLKLGELWAIPIMLRLALIENLRRVGARVVDDRIDRDLADALGRPHDRGRRARSEEPDPGRRRHGALGAADDQRVRRRARAPPAGPERGAGAAADLDRAAAGRQRRRRSSRWCRPRASSRPPTRSRSATASAACASSATMDWREFVETLSVVEQHAARGPGRRLRARWTSPPATATATSSSGSRAAAASPETDVARQACARSWRRRAPRSAATIDRRRACRLLPGRRRPARARARRCRVRGVARCVRTDRARACRCSPTPSPVRCSIVALVALGAARRSAPLARHRRGCWLVAGAARRSRSASWRWRWSTGSRRCWSPPRRAAAHGLFRRHPGATRARWWSCRRCSAAPTASTRLVEALEVRFLANRDAHLHFALLTDFLDAAEETLPDDDALLDARAARRSTRSTRATRRTARDRFFLFHRPRRWNARERAWMGYERKRGKLAALNALLRGGATRAASSRIVGDTDALRRRALRHHARHRHAAAARRRARARRHDGASAQPRRASTTRPPRRHARLRHPAAARRHQPAAANALALRAACSAASRASIRTRARCRTSTRTCSAKARSSARASTTSTRSSARSAGACRRTASSATTCSKAATRAPAWSATCSCSRTTRRATPPTSSGATAGSAATGRCCRWLLPRVPRRRPRRERNPLSPLSRGKIFDNLRRSLVPAALTALLVLGWTLLPRAAAVDAVACCRSCCCRRCVGVGDRAGRRAAGSAGCARTCARSRSPPGAQLRAARC